MFVRRIETGTFRTVSVPIWMESARATDNWRRPGCPAPEIIASAIGRTSARMDVSRVIAVRSAPVSITRSARRPFTSAATRIFRSLNVKGTMWWVGRVAVDRGRDAAPERSEELDLQRRDLRIATEPPREARDVFLQDLGRVVEPIEPFVQLADEHEHFGILGHPRGRPARRSSASVTCPRVASDRATPNRALATAATARRRPGTPLRPHRTALHPTARRRTSCPLQGRFRPRL